MSRALYSVGTIPSLPIGQAPVPPSQLDQLPGSPLTGLDRPAPADQTLVVARRLDRGRLSATALVNALGWAPSTLLTASIHNDLVVLRSTGQAARPGTTTAHTDAKGQIVIGEGLRARLGNDANGHVLALVGGTEDGLCLEIAATAQLRRAMSHLANRNECRHPTHRDDAEYQPGNVVA